MTQQGPGGDAPPGPFQVLWRDSRGSIRRVIRVVLVVSTAAIAGLACARGLWVRGVDGSIGTGRIRTASERKRDQRAQGEKLPHGEASIRSMRVSLGGCARKCAPPLREAQTATWARVVVKSQGIVMHFLHRMKCFVGTEL
jgi:hypothetical protein